jgi:putative heme-binding domain-containing protein
MRLAQADQVPEDPEVFRQVILRGLLLRENGSRKAVELLERWTGKQLSESDDDWEKALALWQDWFVDEFPDAPAPNLPVESEQNHWTYQELLSFLTGPQASQGNAARGAVLFEKAQCVKCHRFGDRGDALGPDLTNVSKRFQKKEILESILFPSQVISDQFAGRTIITKDGKTITGLTAPSGDGSLVVLQPNGQKLVIVEADVEQSTRSKVSAMPDGLLNVLSLEEIVDLFAYLTTPRTEMARRPTRVR